MDDGSWGTRLRSYRLACRAYSLAQLITAILRNVEQIPYTDVHEDPEKTLGFWRL